VREGKREIRGEIERAERTMSERENGVGGGKERNNEERWKGRRERKREKGEERGDR
jgi:hypothetical protein